MRTISATSWPRPRPVTRAWHASWLLAVVGALGGCAGDSGFGLASAPCIRAIEQATQFGSVERLLSGVTIGSDEYAQYTAERAVAMGAEDDAGDVAPDEGRFEMDGAQLCAVAGDFGPPRGPPGVVGEHYDVVVLIERPDGSVELDMLSRRSDLASFWPIDLADDLAVTDS